ncbi:Protein O-mannosyltransferase 2, partial [Coelomomyces lativittatus]
MHEVSGYGNDTVGDANDHWLVEVVKDFHRAPPYTTLHTMATQFRLRHAVSGCLLRSHQVSLPKWGFNQAEVVCDQRKTSKKETDQNNVWNVEQHWNPEFPPAPFTHFQSRFLQNVMDLNVAMMASNNALTPDPDKEPDGLTSTPSQWPFLTTGLRMCSWGDTDIKFYMLGNPLVWWFSSVSLGVYVITWCGYQVRAKCHYAYPTMYPRFVYLGKYLLGAWFLHYFPFFLMGLSGYGNDTVGDANDHWLVEVVKDFHRAPPYTTLHTMATQFRLRHAVSGCLLRSHQVSLPKWGFNQAEVVCDQRKTSKKETDQNNVWNVEQHWNPEFPPAPFTHFQSRFLQNVMDLNVAMMASNNALTPDPDKEPDGLTSTPSQWPFLTTGLRMCSWGDTDIKFYMLGNPLVWWFSSVSLGVYVITWCGYQ